MQGLSGSQTERSFQTDLVALSFASKAVPEGNLPTRKTFRVTTKKPTWISSGPWCAIMVPARLYMRVGWFSSR